jgi:glycosyltransferase involved in cell wall biosynthesis
MTPLVSIGVPTYNGAQFLRECLDSVLGQTFKDFEVNIVDDGSGDETVAIANAYANQDPRIAVRLNPTRLGLVGNFNRCVSLARGKYVCIFGQDDVMLPENLAEKVKLLESTPNVGFVHSNIFRIHDHGKVFAEHWETSSTQNYVQTGRQIMSKLLVGTNHICCPSVLARKTCFDHAGTFDDRLFFTCDWEMWMRLCADYDVACLGRPLVKFRRHSRTESKRVGGTRLELEQELLAKQIIFSRYKDRIIPVRAVMREAWDNLGRKAVLTARKAFYENDFENCRRCLFFAIRIRPSLIAQSECLNLLIKALLGRRAAHAYRWLTSTITR